MEAILEHLTCLYDIWWHIKHSTSCHGAIEPTSLVQC